MIHDFCLVAEAGSGEALDAMARRVRIEYAGAVYHVINRGNYRTSIFDTQGARKSFLECLRHCCEAQGWRLHAWVLMGNHYHLCVETPVPNLVEGMKWLQSTFANRFNRFRQANGHVFQGRYKAILLDGEAVGAVCHYIQLNPVRAGLVDCRRLETYEHSSFRRLWCPRKREAFESFNLALESAGGLKDTPAGRHLYRDYLGWLSEEEGEKKRLGFERMCRGWAKGTKEFKKAVLEDLKDEVALRVVESEASELREPRWERAVEELLGLLGRAEDDLWDAPKGAGWKVAIARRLRERYLAPNRWIADRLCMGRVSSVQSRISRHRSNARSNNDPDWKRLQNHETLG